MKGINVRGYIFKLEDISVLGPLVFEKNGNDIKKFSIYSKGFKFDFRPGNNSQTEFKNFFELHSYLKKLLLKEI